MKRIYFLLLSVLMYTFMAFFVRGSEGANVPGLDGLIEPYMVVNVGSPVPGILKSVTVDRGGMVKEGQVLATLQSGVEKAAMELARARTEMEATIKAKREELEFIKRREQRMKNLYSQKILPFQEWDEVETQKVLAEYELAEALENKRFAELDLNRAIELVYRMTIRSPVTGVVVERYLSPGEFVEDQPILKLAQIDPLNVEVIVPVDMLGSIWVGMRAKVKPEAPIHGIYSATVTIIDRVVDAASGTFGVRLELPNSDYRLPPGLKCKVIFLHK